jgi:hypothetical protein
MTPGTNRRCSIFGAVDLASGRFFYQIARKAVSATFIAFLEQLPQAYPAAPVVAVICDKVIIHRSKLVKRWLATTPGCGAARSSLQPHDNPVERIWVGSRRGWRTPRRRPSRAASARCTPSSGLVVPRRSWRPPRRAAHRGYPRVTAELPGGCLAEATVPKVTALG